MSIESDGLGSGIEDEPGSPVVETLLDLGNVVLTISLGRHVESSGSFHGKLKVELLSVLWLLVWLSLLLLDMLGGSGNDGLNSWLGGSSHLSLDGDSHDVELLEWSLSAGLPGEVGVWVLGVLVGSEAEFGPLVNFSSDLTSLPGVLLGGFVLEKSDSSWRSVSSGLELEAKSEVSLMEESDRLGSGVVGPSLVVVVGVESSVNNWVLIRKSSNSLDVSESVLWS